MDIGLVVIKIDRRLIDAALVYCLWIFDFIYDLVYFSCVTVIVNNILDSSVPESLNQIEHVLAIPCQEFSRLVQFRKYNSA